MSDSNVSLLANACDCHVHIVGPKNQYPLPSLSSYTPMDATVSDLQTLQKTMGLSRAVIVQPSFYGTDNTCMLAALGALAGSGRGVAALAEDCENKTIDAMHDDGVRGIRINALSIGHQGPDEIKARIRIASKQAERNRWHVQLFIAPDTIADLSQFLLDQPVDIVLDHFAMIKPLTTPPFEKKAIYRLLESGKIWIKLSGTYRINADPFAESVNALAQKLIAINPERIIWGSDWPHTPKHSGIPISDPPNIPYRKIDTQALIKQCWAWGAGDVQQARQILVMNPMCLYDFSPSVLNKVKEAQK